MDMIGYNQRAATPITQDNNACIYLVKGSSMYNRARQIDIWVYRIRELASEPSPDVQLSKIASEDQPSNIFTKGLPRHAIENYMAVLMGKT